MAVPDRVIFDAEPLIAHADDELGSDVVEEYLDAVAAGDAFGYACCVNLAEIRYTLARKYDRPTADDYLDWLSEIGIEPVDVGDAWVGASEYVLTHTPVLGDSFVLAAAETVEATLLVGGDGDYNDISDISIERFRDGAG